MLIRKGWFAGFAMAMVLAMTAGLIQGCGGSDDGGASGATVAKQDGSEGGSTDGNGQGAQEGGAGDGEDSLGGDAAFDEAESGSSAPAGGSGGSGSGSNDGAGSGSPSSGKAGLAGGSAKSRSGKSGGSSGSSPSGGGAAEGSSGNFFEQADAICKERRADTRQRISDFTKVGLDNLEKNSEAIVDELIIPNLETERREIEALPPPPSASEAANVLFTGIEEMIASGEAEPRNFILKGEVVVKSEEAAKKSGFNLCGGI